MLLKCECNYKDTINYGIMWIVSYIQIFVERFIVVYPFYRKKKNRAHARLLNIKKKNVKAYEFQFRIISLCFEFWCRKYITGHDAKPKWFRCRYIIKFECLAIYQVQNNDISGYKFVISHVFSIQVACVMRKQSNT